MARIPTYQKDVNISDLDSFLGTDGDSNELTTKNFHLGDVANYVIDKLIDPDATDFQIPVFNQSGNRITGSIMSQDSSLSNGVAGTKITIAGNTTTTGNVKIDTLTSGYIPFVNSPAGNVLRDSGFYQVSAPVTADKAIGLNTTKLGSVYGEYPDLRVASRSLNDPGVLDLFRPDGDVQAGDRVGILQYSLDDQSAYAVAQIEVKTIGNSGSGNSGGGKFCIKTSTNVSGAQPTERLCIDNTGADFSVPINVTDLNQSSFAGQVTIPTTPVAATDAASKAYVDSQFSGGSVTGTGTTNALPIWSDGPNGVLGDSPITQILDFGGNVKEINIATTSGNAAHFDINGAGGKVIFGLPSSTPAFELKIDNTGYYSRNFQMRGTLAVGRSQQSTAATLDVGNAGDLYPAALFRHGVVISNNPSGVQVDNTSMVIGAGNNDVVYGSDNCLVVGNNNRILEDSDNSLAVGQGNTITNNSDNSFAIGQGNTIDGSNTGTNSVRSQVLGYQNSLTGSFSSLIAGGQNTVTTSQNAVALGFSHTLSGADSMFAFGENNTGPSGANDNNSFMIGGNLTGTDGTMALGFRNDTSSYPATDYSNGLGNTKFAVSVGTVTNSNAIIITEGGVNRGGGVAQVPRVVLPTVVEFNFANDADAASNGIPVGGIYHHNGNLKIRII